MRVCMVVGARPQFIKACAVSRALRDAGVDHDLVHTGQHYDDLMSRRFFEELDIPDVVVNLEVGSGSHAVQTGSIMARLERFLKECDPYEVLFVYGDTNSTIAAALVGAKFHIPVAHVEAGLRSFNRAMPEEINRIVTDRLSDLLFCPSETAVTNLAAEGIEEGVVNCGDVMYDALLRFLPRATATYPLESLIPFSSGEYYLATVHRAENTDDRSRLQRILEIFAGLELPAVWPVHPRTQTRLDEFGIKTPPPVHALPPAGYLVLLTLLSGARAVLTDSGGLQKEAFWMKRPCITLRSETEWVETLNGGCNVVTDLDFEMVKSALLSTPVFAEGWTPYGNGDACSTIVESLHAWMS